MPIHLFTPNTRKDSLQWHTNAHYGLTYDPSNELMLIRAHRGIQYHADAASYQLGIMYTNARSRAHKAVSSLSDLHKCAT